MKDSTVDETTHKRYSFKLQLLAILFIVCSAASGAMLGIILTESSPSKELVAWIALPGQLFIRALKLIILPLVFVNVILAMIQLSAAGKAKIVGFYTVAIYTFTTIVASAEGLIMVFLFKDKFSIKEPEITLDYVFLSCKDDFVLYQGSDRVSCINVTTIPFENIAKTHFAIKDLNDYFITSNEEFESATLSETLQDNIFKQMVPENIFEEFAEFRFIGVIMFSIIMGSASQAISHKPIILEDLLREINDILIKIVVWIICLTPFSVFSLIAGALAEQEDLIQTLQDVAVLIGATLIADFTHVFIFWPLFFYSMTKQNPFSYMKYLFPAQMFGFASGSSAATLPVNLRCVEASGMVPNAIRDFVLPIGTTINMDGIAIYFPPALIFLSSSVNEPTSFAQYILIVLVATIGSAGTAPVPNGSLLLLLTAYTTVYGTEVPDSFGILFGVHWFIGRCTVIISVTGDAMVARIVTYLTEKKGLELNTVNS